MNKFPIGEVIRFSWDLYKKEWKNLLLVFFVLLAINYIPSIISQVLSKNAPLISILASLLSIILNLVTNLGMLKVMLNVADGGSANINDLFFAFRKMGLVGKYLLTSIIYGFVVFLSGLPVGIMTFLTIRPYYDMNRFSQEINKPNLIILVPLLVLFTGIIFVLVTRFQFWYYLLVDKEIWEFTSLRKSWNMTKGFVLHLILFGFALLLLNLAGLIALFVGLVVTLPVSMLAMARVYRILEQGRTIPVAPAVNLTSSTPTPASPPPIASS